MSARLPRSAGLLLHPTSLPGPFGIGDLGPAAHRWVDTLADARQTWWQILPVGPTGFGDSPYQSFSTFAGSMNLISPEALVRDGLLGEHEIRGRSFPNDRVDYTAVSKFKHDLVRTAWGHFQNGAAGYLRDAYNWFLHERREWLGDYALFMAIKDSRGGQPWYEWPEKLRCRDAERCPDLDTARRDLAEPINVYQFGQFLFLRQWHDLRRRARERRIRLIGDVPIFVSPDSADVWANPRQYLLDASYRPKVVAGVPPDYFSKTGQLWGNPHYDWEAMKATGYSWWVARVRAMLELVDLVRIDHFRGFAAAWQVPASEETAVRGEWVKGPGIEFFHRLRHELGGLPFIAEDLGEITPDVYQLRDDLGLPGMKILQFAFSDSKNPFLPHNYTPNCVVYTGTHDNDTTRGWWAQVPAEEKHFYCQYTGRDGSHIAWDLIRMAWGSVADLAVAPVQDILDLPTEYRMNLPGTGQGNWKWRMAEGALDAKILDRVAEFTEVFGRCPPR